MTTSEKTNRRPRAARIICTDCYSVWAKHSDLPERCRGYAEWVMPNAAYVGGWERLQDGDAFEYDPEKGHLVPMPFPLPE